LDEAGIDKKTTRMVTARLQGFMRVFKLAKTHAARQLDCRSRGKSICTNDLAGSCNRDLFEVAGAVFVAELQPGNVMD